MTPNTTLQIVDQPTLRRIAPAGPPSMGRAAFEQWQRSFDTLMGMLADSVGADSPDERHAAHRLEYHAVHTDGPAGRTLAECAALNASRLPAEVRMVARALAESTWQLYDVVGDAEPGVLLRRIHDDASFVCHAFQGGAGVFAGEVYALRLLDAGRFVASTLPIHIAPARATTLAARLEQEYASRASAWSWTQYLAERGSRMILESLEQTSARLVDTSATPDPLTCKAETSIPSADWERLERWYARLAHTRTDARLLRVTLPTGRIANAYGRADNLVVEVRDGDNSGFIRVWSGDEDGAFPEDTVGIDDGGHVVFAARQDADHVWHDITRADLERLVGAMRWVAVQSALGESKAA